MTGCATSDNTLLCTERSKSLPLQTHLVKRVSIVYKDRLWSDDSSKQNQAGKTMNTITVRQHWLLQLALCATRKYLITCAIKGDDSALCRGSNKNKQQYTQAHGYYRLELQLR
eukprot:7719-Heterococcus_DN1.PRE.2